MARTTDHHISNRPDHAIVLGASMAGLAAAATLARRFDRVTIVERDHLTEAGEPRKGVPQGRHVHALLPGGYEALTQLFPRLADDVCAAGGEVLDPMAFRFHIGGGQLLPVDYGHVVLDATRPLLEGVVRERVRALPNVTFIGSCDVRGVVTTPDRSRVTGARLLRRADSSAEELLAADLVVDATGRGSRTPRWLTELGYRAPTEERIRVDVHYVTRLFRHRPGDIDGARQVLTAQAPGARRGGAAMVVEGGRWQVTLVGFLGERPPTDLDGFIDYAASLWAPDIHTIVRHAEPVGEAQTASYPANTRRRYDRLDRLPERYVVLGDALCSFNPVYGQGMSVAAKEAVCLGEVLDRHGLDHVGRRFFRSSRRVVDIAWSLATDADLSDPEVEGPRTRRWRLVNGYLQRLFPVAHRHPMVSLAFLRVIGLLAPPESLMAPSVLWRVLVAGRRAHRDAPATSPTPVTAASRPRILER
jgi:2-polyprenyl-6-methoxyphenol hydroxylase-like FAD-dependent oxidoreductase